MRAVLPLRLGRVKADAVVRDDDLMAALRLPREHADDALLPDAYPVPNGVFDERLHREWRQ